MESVGVYRFCGCTAKNKMKCDSRWEMTASGCGIPLERGSVGRCVCVPLPDVTAVTVGVEQLSRPDIVSVEPREILNRELLRVDTRMPYPPLDFLCWSHGSSE